MRALTWHGKHDVRMDTVPDPVIEDPRDVIIKVTACAICGSDLHLYDGYMPTMESGDILGHETMGEVVEVGAAVTKLKKGDRIVTPFNMACGECWFCQNKLFSCCDNSNRNKEMAAKLMGHSPAGLFGYSHLLGGYAGGQAEYLRIPYADMGHVKVPEGIPDEKVLFISDIFPTGWMAAENANIQPGDTVAIWGCGPVGQFAIRSAILMGAGRVIAIDEEEDRLKMARDGGAETLNFKDVKIYDELQRLTNDRGPDSCIDCVGCEAAGHGSFDAVLDRVKAAAFLATDRIHVLREMVMCCRKGGRLSVPGVYVGFVDKFPMGALMNKALTMTGGQTHTHRYLEPLLNLVVEGKIDPSFVITHKGSLDDGPELYKTFHGHKDNCIKCVMTPHG